MSRLILLTDLGGDPATIRDLKSVLLAQARTDLASAPAADGFRLVVPTTARACFRYFDIAESNLAVSSLVRSMANDRPRYENSIVLPSPSSISFPDRSLTSFVITRLATSLDLLVRGWDRAHYCPGRVWSLGDTGGDGFGGGLLGAAARIVMARYGSDGSQVLRAGA